VAGRRVVGFAGLDYVRAVCVRERQSSLPKLPSVRLRWLLEPARRAGPVRQPHDAEERSHGRDLSVQPSSLSWALGRHASLVGAGPRIHAGSRRSRSSAAVSTRPWKLAHPAETQEVSHRRAERRSLSWLQHTATVSAGRIGRCLSGRGGASLEGRRQSRVAPLRMRLLQLTDRWRGPIAETTAAASSGCVKRIRSSIGSITPAATALSSRSDSEPAA